MVDSGANANFVSVNFIRQHRLTTSRKTTPYRLNVIDGSPINTESGNITSELLDLPLQIYQHKEIISLDIIPMDTYDVILGIPWLQQHNPTINWTRRNLSLKHCLNHTSSKPLIQPNITTVNGTQLLENLEEPYTGGYLYPVPTDNTPTNSNGLPKEYLEYTDVFSEESATHLPKHQPWDHEIPLEKDTKPKFGPIYSLSEVELGSLRDYIERNLATGYIRPSQSPAGHPIIFVKKSDGTLRLCVDYRSLNAITIKNRYALPLISELLDRVQGAKIFTKLDLRDAYHRVRIAEGDEWKTAFRTRYGHFEYQVMPFGLTNAPASFQGLINNVLREYLDLFVVVYLDDILIYSKDITEHSTHVKQVLTALRKAELLVKLEKCVFSSTSIDFLGYIISTDGIKMDPRKVSAVQDWPVPKTVKEVMAFLGLANFYRRFISQYSKIATPLTALLKKENASFTWTKEAQKAFDLLKARFTTAPVLAVFDPAQPITIEADASDFAIGACLSQPDSTGRLHPVAFYSKKLSPAELNYEIYDKELLAIVVSFQEWRVYLEGARHTITIFSDHKNLLYFTTTKVLNRRQTRWSELLNSYDFKITYRPGPANSKADALSRRSDLMPLSFKPQPSSIFTTDKKDPTSLRYNSTAVLAATSLVLSETEKTIIQAYGKDPATNRLLEQFRNDKIPPDNPYKLTKEGLILFNGFTFLPNSNTIRQKILVDLHDSKVAGHFGIEKTLELLARTYYFPKMRNYVTRYINSCVICQRSKTSRHAQYGLLRPLPTSKQPWFSISFDFIVKLPPSAEPLHPKQPYDSILVIVDRLTKYGLFIPYKEASGAEEFAYTILRHVVATFGLPSEFISDRDTRFTAKFSQTLWALLGVKQKLSTSFHPQTDGQTERLNQTLEQYLRCFTTYKQDNWAALLPLAQFAYNNSVNATTGVTPYYANYGFHPQLFTKSLAERISSTAEQAKLLASELKELHHQLAMDITYAAERSAYYANQSRLQAPQYVVGEKVWILRRNIKTKRPSDKLDDKKIGPYPIKRVINNISYEVQLPYTVKLHPVFHTSLLEPVNTDKLRVIQTEPRPVTTADSEDTTEYEVEYLVDYVNNQKGPQYLVHWKNYPISERTWEPANNLPKPLKDDYKKRLQENTIGVRRSSRLLPE